MTTVNLAAPPAFRLTGCAKTGGCAAKVGPGDLAQLIGPLAGRLRGGDARVLVGPETGDDAGVFLLDGRALIATTDFIPPLCDDPFRFGRIAAANALSDVYAMGGKPLFALNLCCFPPPASLRASWRQSWKAAPRRWPKPERRCWAAIRCAIPSSSSAWR